MDTEEVPVTTEGETSDVSAASEQSDAESSASEGKRDGHLSAERSRSDGDGGADESQLGMAYERSTTSLKRLRQTQLDALRRREENLAEARSKDPALRGDTEMSRFRSLVCRRFGSLTRGWRSAIDLRSEHRIGFLDFTRALRQLGFSGRAKAMWSELTKGKGMLTLDELDPESALALREFSERFKSEFDEGLAIILQRSDSGQITRQDFFRECASIESETVDLTLIFEALEMTKGFLRVDDCRWLDSYIAFYKCGGKRKKYLAATAPPSFKVEYSDVLLAQRGKQALEAFRVMLQHRFGSILQAWRTKLDPEMSGEMGEEELEYRVTQIGFDGDFSDLWQELTDGVKDAITLNDLDPAPEEARLEFVRSCKTRFGSLPAAFAELKAERKPLVTATEFHAFCSEIIFKKNAKLLFNYLDGEEAGVVVITDVDPDNSSGFTEEQIDEAREQITADKEKGVEGKEKDGAPKHEFKPRRIGLDALLDYLEEKFRSPVHAWRKVYDVRGRGELTKGEFEKACLAVGFCGSVKTVCQELELDENSKVRLKDLAPRVGEDCQEFKRIAKRTHDGVLRAMAEYIGTENVNKVKMNMEEFAKFCDHLGYVGSRQTLFAHLDLADSGVLTFKNLKWLEESKESERGMAKALRKIARKRWDAWNKRQKEIKPPNADVARTQDKALTEARAKRSTGRTDKEDKEEFLRQMAAEYGSVARGWVVAMDPDGNGSVSAQEWLNGCTRAGFLDPAASGQDEYDHYDRMFEVFLSDVDEGRVFFGDFDPATVELMEKVKRALKVRYGTLKKAFWSVDPMGTGRIGVTDFKQLLRECKCQEAIFRVSLYLDPQEEGEIELANIDERAAERAQKAARQDLERGRRKYGPRWKPKAALEIEPDVEVPLRSAVTQKRIDAKNGTNKEDPAGDETEAAPAAPSSPKRVPSSRKEENESAASSSATAADDEGNAQHTATSILSVTKHVNKDAAQCFREHLQRRFGTTWRAWCSLIDRSHRVVLNKVQFMNGVNSCGYSGSPTPLWAAVLANAPSPSDEETPKATVSFREIDPAAFALMVNLRRSCMKRLSGLLAVFTDLDRSKKPQLTYDKPAFAKLCERVRCRQAEEIFDLLDINRAGILSWQDVRFLEEDWKWTPKTVKPVERRLPATPPVPEGVDAVRVAGTGHLALSFKPRRVVLPKSPSEPLLPRPMIRPEWDCRHHVPARVKDPSAELVQGICAAGKFQQAKLRQGIAQALIEEPTTEWLAQHGPANLPDPPPCDYVSTEDIHRREQEKRSKTLKNLASSMIAVTRGTEFHAHL
mmetsp:Transcript_34533/g.78876  ORF Transcript_34533/g.78876 Transcript_34533/m.78876 type:complete len:1298 (-) Transcript_34533:65-3958(-)